MKVSFCTFILLFGILKNCRPEHVIFFCAFVHTIFMTPVTIDAQKGGMDDGSRQFAEAKSAKTAKAAETGAAAKAAARAAKTAKAKAEERAIP